MTRQHRWIAAISIVVLGVVLPPAWAGDSSWTAPAAEKSKKNPVPRQAGMQSGKKIYDENCQVCHGPTGKGDGPAGAALNPKPRNFDSKAVQAESDGELFWKITTGHEAMPSWQQLPEKERWSLVHYIRSLGKK